MRREMKTRPGHVFLLRFVCVLWTALALLFCGCAVRSPETPSEALPEQLVFGIPGPSDLRLDRKGFSLGYDHTTRQAVWVCYILTAEQMTGPRVRRAGKFQADPAVRYRPVKPRDYTRTGYDRGHLAAAADMAYSKETMTHSFYMTNISPQLPGCNRGIWKRLETHVREWAEREGKICVVTGPVFASGASAQMGTSGIPVPVAFYKVIYDMTPPEKMIGFIVPNAPSKKNVRAFAVTVDAVENAVGLDFFSELDDKEEDRLEREFDLAAWGLAPAQKDPSRTAPAERGGKHAPGVPLRP